ncbi:class I SAM-dependent methyltransferase [Sphingomonas sp. RB1R13]|uniref:class I SAM-dependent methyltransferase n=1 Tax=Sphingomonas sp. RB1R13 TaxID=3096159 RepID=UPI002FC8E1F0
MAIPLILIRVGNALGKPFGVNPFPRAFVNANAPDGREAAFDAIYQNNGWNSTESLSGPGSEVERTKAYRRELEQCLNCLDTKTLFDAPCGDLNWILPVVGERAYIGGDIASSLIADLQKTHPDLDLRVFDICTDEFPACDVWHCRDCLFHLPFDDIWKALQNYIDSGIPYALLTTHRSRALHRNVDVRAGGWRYLDLEMAPFSLVRPRAYLRDFRPLFDFPRYVGLWSREQIGRALTQRMETKHR